MTSVRLRFCSLWCPVLSEACHSHAARHHQLAFPTESVTGQSGRRRPHGTHRAIYETLGELARDQLIQPECGPELLSVRAATGRRWWSQVWGAE